jgi:hypothetical protein
VKIKHKKLTILLTTVGAVMVVGGAVAFWTSTGTGTAATTVANADPVTITAGTPTEELFPGTSADVALRITNPNSFSVNVPSLVLTNEGTDGFEVDGSDPGCNLSALSYPNVQDNGGPGWTVPGTSAPQNYLDVDLTDAVQLATSAANECQGLTFKVYLTVGT